MYYYERTWKKNNMNASQNLQQLTIHCQCAVHRAQEFMQMYPDRVQLLPGESQAGALCF